MTDPDPRYAGGCTNWGAYDVPALAGFLDEDHARSWAQVSAWSRAADLTGDHLTVLRQARETITRVWPPSTNQAAEAYLAQLDALMASMDTMKVAAEANAEALSGILTVLGDAKGKVDALYEQWKQQEPSWWVSDALAVNKVMTAGVVTNSTERAMQQRKADLNSQAQKVMRETDDSTYEYLPRLVAVPPPPPSDYHAAPPVPTTGSKSIGGDPSSRPGSVRRPNIPPAALPATGGGVVLTGDAVPLGPPGETVVGRPVQNSDGRVSAPGFGQAVQSPWVQTSIGRVLRSGAVLGTPQEPSGPDSRTGVSGDRDNTGRARGEPVDPEAGMWAGGGVPGGRAADRRRQRRLPPDTEWPTPKGVPPVLEPGPEPVHDPGPGVIGIDR